MFPLPANTIVRTHPQNFGSLSSSQLTEEMQKLEQALANILGVKVITDDVDAQDWNGYSAAQSQQQFQAAGASGNGHIPLMHETYASTVQELTPWLIDWAASNNLKLVTVAECLGDAGGAYSATGLPGNGQNSC